MVKKRFLWPAVLLLPASLALGGHLWADWHYRAARRARAQQDLAGAEHHLSRCAKVWFLGAETHLLLARTARLAGKYDRADAYLRDCQNLGVSPETIALEYQLLRVRQGDLASVERQLVGRVTQGHPDSVLILETLTPVYLANFQLQHALACVERWLEIEPDRAQVWLYRAQVSERFKNATETLTSYRRVVELDPDNVDARLTLAGLLTEGHDPREALAHFESVRQRGEDQPAILTGLARCRRVMGQEAEARRLLEAVLEAHPGSWAALSERARLALETETAEEAEKWFRRAALAKPSEKDVLWGHYTCLIRLGKHQDAENVLAALKRVEADQERLKQLTHEVAQNPHDPDLRCEVASILMRNGQEAAAVGWLTTALRAAPRHAPTHRALAEYYERTGNRGLADPHRRQAREGDARTPAPGEAAP
jgi:predicted Zn-dependent protease